MYVGGCVVCMWVGGCEWAVQWVGVLQTCVCLCGCMG